ncbi:unnamed protein product, partial [Ectocarpus sp. 8 AP-2014]
LNVGRYGPRRRKYPSWWTYNELSTKFIKVAMSHMKHVAGDAIWLKTNPGQQDSLLTGSFHPMSSSRDEWEKGAYN